MEWIVELFDSCKELLSELSIMNVSLWVILITAFGYRCVIKLFLPHGDKIGG